MIGEKTMRIALLLAAPALLLAQPVAGPNVNMVAGTQWPNGDPFLQRQNEPSIAVSTRNPQHLLAGGNDYRTVDLSAISDKLVGDAWLGLYKSLDGGQTWTSTLLPGCPYNTPECMPNLVFPAGGQSILSRQFGVNYGGADATVRAGTNGMFYFSGIAFERRDRPISQLHVSRFIDDNNYERVGLDPIRYLSTSTPDINLGTEFIDKPWLAVDRPRTGAATCTIPAGPGNRPPAQSFPGGNVYVAYARFVGTTDQARLMFSRSTDCGVTWSFPTQISGTFFSNQGATIGIDPRNGNVFVAWRRFASGAETDAIMIAKSTTGGRTFGAPEVVAPLIGFDLPKSPAGVRTLSFPSIAVDANGRVYLVYASRLAVNGESRIMLTSAVDGVGWTPPALVDPPVALYDSSLAIPQLIHPGRGHQLMPSLSTANGRLAVVFYDLREDSTVGELRCPPGQTCDNVTQYREYRKPIGTFLPFPPSPNAAQLATVFTPALVDSTPFGGVPLLRRHLIDVRVAMAPIGLAPTFTGAKVSQYATGSSSSNPGVPKSIRQLRENVANLPMFAQGTTPFIGDYLDISAQPFVPGATPGSWVENNSTASRPVFYTSWADNRDVIPPADGNWRNYTPLRVPFTGPQGPACVAGQSGMRNQNLYMSRISEGLTVVTEGNAKQLSPTLKRSFSVTAQNNTDQSRSYRFSIAGQPPGGSASFTESGPLLNLDALVPARSSASRSVFVTSSNPKASVQVNVTEVTTPGGPIVFNGQSAQTRMNPDLSNPDLSNPDLSNPDLSNITLYTPDLSNPDLSNPDLSNPDLSNPDLSNPDLSNPDLSNPDLSNPDLSNPDLSNPDLSNPDLSNPDLSNTTFRTSAMKDATWRITNKGNSTATYRLRIVTPGGVAPSGFKTQMLVHKTFAVPGKGVATCQVVERAQNILIANVPNPAFELDTASRFALEDPGTGDTNTVTITLRPGETGRVTLRVVAPTLAQAEEFFTVVQPVVVSQPSNSIATAARAALAITRMVLPGCFLPGTLFNDTLTTVGGQAPLTYEVSAGTLPPGLILGTATGTLIGTLTTTGLYTFTVRVRDSATAQQEDTQTITIGVRGILTLPPMIVLDGLTGTAFNQALDVTGGLAPFIWSITGGALPPGLSLNSSGAVVGTPTLAGVYSFSARVTDSCGSGQVANRSYTMRVADPLILTTATQDDMLRGIAYTRTFATTGGTTPFTWSISAGALPLGLSLTAAGQITGTPNTNGTYVFTVRSTDAGNLAQAPTRAYTIRVVDQLAIATLTLPDAIDGVAYSTALVATGGIPGFTYALTSGTLPSGFTMNAAGVISGTTAYPGIRNDFSIVVTATDSGTPAQQFTRGFSIFVHQRLLITTATLPDIAAGQPYLYDLIFSGGAGAITWTVSTGTLPTGLVLDTFGRITGTPTTTGTLAFTVQATDQANPNQVVTRPLTINVPQLLQVATASLPDGVRSASYTATLATTGGTGSKTWALASGSLPPGLSLSPAGVISGIPTVTGNTGFSVFVSDSGAPPQSTGATALVIRIFDPLAGATAGALPVARQTVTYSTTLVVSGGFSGKNFTLDSGTIPPGLTLAASGVLSGIPTAPGTYNFTYRVADSAVPPQVLTPAVSMVVVADLQVATATLPAGRYGEAYSQTLAATGGTPPYTWSGTPPAGLSLSLAGVLSGTRSTFGTPLDVLNVIVNVSDGVQTKQRTLSLTLTNGFDAAGSMSVIRMGAAAVRVGTRVLVMGGLPLIFGQGTPMASTEFYDPATNAFSAGPSMTQPRVFHTATLLADGRVLVVGGIPTPNATPTVLAEIYDPGTNTFTATGSLSQSRYHHSAVLLPSGKVLVAGGLAIPGLLQTTEVFDPVTGAFSSGPALSVARGGIPAILIPSTGKVLLAGGGIDGTTVPASAVAELYDPVTNTITPTGSLQAAESRGSATLLGNGKILIVGFSAHVYDPAAGTFGAPVTTGLPSRQGNRAALLPNGRVLISGGAASTSYQFYDPAANTVSAPISIVSAGGQELMEHILIPLADGRLLQAGRRFLTQADIYTPLP